MSDDDHVSYSRLRTFKRCRQQWYYRYVDKLEPKIRPSVVGIGDLAHRAIAQYYKKHDWREAKAQFEKQYPDQDDLFYEILEENWEVVQRMMPNYIEYAEKEDKKWFQEHIHVEWEFEVPIPTVTSLRQGNWRPSKKMFRAIIDMLVRDQQKNWWVWENKFIKQSPHNFEELEYDEQTFHYLWAVRETFRRPDVLKLSGVKLEGVIFNLVRHKPPMKDPNTWVLRDKTYRTPEQVDNIGLEIALQAADLRRCEKAVEAKDDTALIYRNFFWGCRDCPYKQVCLSDFKGYDTTPMRLNSFQEVTRKIAR
jgi:hypothetical protein